VSAAELAGWNKVSPGASFKAKQSVVLYLPKKARAAGSKAGKGSKATARSAKAGKSAKASTARAAKGKAAVVKKPRKR
jgi:membrane-bound lytic murein transglycosylase D